MENPAENCPAKTIAEGQAFIEIDDKVFYNPVQEFNRDLSLSVLQVFADDFVAEQNAGNVKRKWKWLKEEIGADRQNGICILEALSATGLRSIRFAKEVSNVRRIVANDLSYKAVESIRKNITNNNVESIVEVANSDAILLMYQHRNDPFDAIDLDPYGCPSMFLDSAVQAVSNGGLLLITATDMAVLSGNCAEACYSKYGSIPLKLKSCHEMALRILLQTVEAHANKYGRYIEPLLSISVDFYIRVFVRVRIGAKQTKLTLSKLGMVYHCTGCGSFALQPLGTVRPHPDNKNFKFGLPSAPAVGTVCPHCSHKQQMGGPIWLAPLHSKQFVQKVLDSAKSTLGTYARIRGVLSMVLEELDDCPLYYSLDRLSSTLHVGTPPMMKMRSALMNSGYRVSYMHACKTSIKTDAPGEVVWDILRAWEKLNPVKEGRYPVDSPGAVIRSKECRTSVDFTINPSANPGSKMQGLVRFQENPAPNWGPGTRSTPMVGDDATSKSKRKQGKKRKSNFDAEPSSPQNQCPE